MKLTDSELQELHRSATVPSSRGDCPSADHLARAAMGELPDAERDALADHIATCTACAGEYRTIAPVRAMMSESGTVVVRRRMVPVTYAAAAAAVVAAVGLASTLWTTSRLRETERRLADRPVWVATPPPASVPIPTPQLNVPIIDLSPRDATRGAPDAQAREQRLVVPARAQSVTLILTTTGRATDPRYAFEIVDAAGRVWIGEGLQPSRDGSFTLTIPVTFLPAGSYRFRLKRAESAGGTLVEEYPVRIEYS